MGTSRSAMAKEFYPSAGIFDGRRAYFGEMVMIFLRFNDIMRCKRFTFLHPLGLNN